MNKLLAHKYKELLKQNPAEAHALIQNEIIGKRLTIDVSTSNLAIDKEKHTAVFVMTTQSKNRYDQVVDQDTLILDYFDQNPAFFWQHESDNFPLGSWIERHMEADPQNVGKQRLVGTARFDVDIDEVAARAWAHVERGNIRMVSIGFIPHRVEYDDQIDAFILHDCEILECSLVGIGANREALVKRDSIDPRKAAIEAKNALEVQLKDHAAISHMKALEDLNRAIRRMA
jgi:HK97 family phage prohead protease